MQRLLNIIEKVLEIDKEKITDETSPQNVDTWDSFAGLMLALELENGFDIKFTAEEISSVTCVKDIKYYLKKHGVRLVGEDESS